MPLYSVPLCPLKATEELCTTRESKYMYEANGDRLASVETVTHAGLHPLCGCVDCGDGSETSGGSDSLTFAYDKLGNPLSYKGKALVWQKGRQLKKFGTLEFTYDGYGRRISKGSTQYVYTTDGKLFRQSDGTNALEFIYDTSGITGGVVAHDQGVTGWEAFGYVMLGGAIGLAAGGLVVATIGAGAAVFGAAGLATPILGVTAYQAFAIGALAYNFFAFVVAPIIGISMDGIGTGAILKK